MERFNGIYVPHTEVNSLILQITIGCKYNQCTFCKTYRYKKYKEIGLDAIENKLIEIQNKEEVINIFLASSDLFALEFKKICDILNLIKKYFPNATHISCYSSVFNTISKTQAQLYKLSDLNLKLIYMGVESGNNDVLKRINKGSSVEDSIIVSQMLHLAGIDLCSSIILGIGGKKYFDVHSLDTAKALNKIKPQQIEITVLMHGKGCRLNEQVEDGVFFPLDEEEVMIELINILENIELTNVIFSTVHISNLVHFYGILPRDKEKFLKQAKSHCI